jgi:hypothetical protein
VAPGETEQFSRAQSQGHGWDDHGFEAIPMRRGQERVCFGLRQGHDLPARAPWRRDRPDHPWDRHPAPFGVAEGGS